ncbi:substrate-binding domain-containing protein [Actinomadura craniellae]|uniref:substrate-binding domain-containing protein n=1 Tax=Actinomadura craniellae TaxID=2231787 RepID=UPI001313EBA6|nr:substrate-binding domain-containing protein [Actinomadura craniellae]
MDDDSPKESPKEPAEEPPEESPGGSSQELPAEPSEVRVAPGWPGEIRLDPPRDVPPTRRGPLRAAAALLAVLLAAGAVAVWRSGVLAPPCADPLTVRVVAHPEIAPALREVAERYTLAENRVRDRCVRVQVVDGTEPGKADAWVPESSIWLGRARAAGLAEVPPMAPQIAVTPVVLAVPQRVAAELRRAGGEPGWRLLRDGRAGKVALSRRVLDPARHATGAIAMLALDQTGEAGGKLVGDLRRGTPATPTALLAGLTGPGRPLLVTTEQAVVAHNRAHPERPAAALLPAEGTLTLDHPFAVLARDPLRREAIAAFEPALRGKPARDALQQAGFRPPDGRFAEGYAARHGLSAEPPALLRFPTQAQLDRAIKAWTDVSGS